MAAFIPTALIGFVLYRLMKDIFFAYPLITVYALGIGGVLLIFLEYFFSKSANPYTRLENLSIKKSLIIGVAQSVSIVPGVSRAAATIIAGIAVGLSREAAVEFSFLLAVPTIFAATILDLFKSGFAFTPEELVLLVIGFFGACITAIVAVRIFHTFVKKKSLTIFGIYRILLALLFLVMMRRS